MTREDYLKKLNFTVESVENGGNDVSGVIEFFGGSCLVFDQKGVEMHDSCGSCLFSIEGSDELIKTLIETVCVKEVKRVFPDCC